ncbi:30S ribosomal protein S2 [Candidatus Falkowbacteria bacterium]|nr:30S ribosomal protein S2 [Candidatus Falkowbacteria bacterium]
MANVTLQDLAKAGAHFGHQSSRWHPKMKQFIFAEKNGIHVINLEKTLEYLNAALEFVKKTVSEGGTVLFLGTKKQAQDIVKDAALACGMPYVIFRWLGGTLTNAHSILGLAKKLRKLKEAKASGELEAKYTKKERLNIDREIARLEIIVGGIERLEKIPNAIFIVDIKKEKTAISEANRKSVPVVAICDTNVNPDLVTYPIPGNDDAVSSIRLFVNLMAEAVKEGKESVKPKE